MADMKLTRDGKAVLTTYTLGACIGVVLYDPREKVGGILHFMLPESRMDPQKARLNPWIFADTGLPLFFEEAFRLGGEKKRIWIKVVGGAEVMGDSAYFSIGKRNYLALRKILWFHNFPLLSEAVGGNVNRAVRLEVSTGKLWVRTPWGEDREL